MNSNEPTKGAVSRRAAVAAGLAPLVVARHVLGGAGYQAPSDKLRIACVGVGGVGAGLCGRLQGAKRSSRFATWTTSSAAPAFKLYPRAKIYKDFRQMFDKEQKNFDALIVATPDHWHSHLVLAGLAMNKHIYCAKPMTRTIAEARRVKAAVPGLQGHHQGEHSGFAHLPCPGHHGIAVERGHRAGTGSALLDRHAQPQRAGTDPRRSRRRPRG